jgi:antitoxin HigA-1
MTNGGFASSGAKSRPAQSMSRSRITTKEADYGALFTPGEHLAEELKELGISAAGLARQIDVPVNRVTGIMNGQRSVTADKALRLGHWFGTSPEFWLNLQTLYELRLARQEIDERVKNCPASPTASPSTRTRPGQFESISIPALNLCFIA